MFRVRALAVFHTLPQHELALLQRHCQFQELALKNANITKIRMVVIGI